MKIVFQAILIIVAIGLASILVISFKIIGYLIGFIVTILIVAGLIYMLLSFMFSSKKKENNNDEKQEREFY